MLDHSAPLASSIGSASMSARMPKRRAPLPRTQRADHAGAADAALHLITPALQLVGHQGRGAVLLEGQLGVAVDVAAQADELAGARLQGIEQVGHVRLTAAAG